MLAFVCEGVEVFECFGGHAGPVSGGAVDFEHLVVEVEDLIAGEAADIFKAALGEALFADGANGAAGCGNEDEESCQREGPVAAQEFGGTVGGSGRACFDRP